MKIDKSEYEFNDTLKATEVKENITAKIVRCDLISTKFGEKRILVLDNEKQVFLNSISIQNLVEGFGDDTDFWAEKEITITTEESERTQGKKSLVVTATKDKKGK